MSLLYDETQDALRDSVRSLLADHCPPARVIAAGDGDTSLGVELWRRMREDLGLGGVAIADDLGGGGASPSEVAVVAEELGRYAAPVPFLTSAVIAPRVLQHCGADDLLRRIADGTSTAALAVPADAFGHVTGSGIAVEGGLVRGTVAAVVGADVADVLVVPAVSADVPVLVAVEASAADIAVASSLDMTRPLADVTFADAAAIELARGDTAIDAVSSGLLMGSAILASEQLGVAEWCLDTTLAYVKQRYQFGRPIGSFQGLKHRLAQLWIAVSGARATARNAARSVGSGDLAAKEAVALAQSQCGDTAVLAAQECVQMHGGIGMTWEHPAHLYLTRAKADQVLFGTPAQYRARLAALNDL